MRRLGALPLLLGLFLVSIPRTAAATGLDECPPGAKVKSGTSDCYAVDCNTDADCGPDIVCKPIGMCVLATGVATQLCAENSCPPPATCSTKKRCFPISMAQRMNLAPPPTAVAPAPPAPAPTDAPSATPTETKKKSSSCGCDAVGSGPGTSGVALVGLAASVLMLRRRRR